MLAEKRKPTPLTTPCGVARYKITEGEVLNMKINKLKIGNTYYLPVKYQPTNYTSGVLVEIINAKRVVLRNKKGNLFACSTEILHKTPDKAVRGRKAQERVRHEMNMQKECLIQKEKESLVAKSIQKKVKELRKKAYATIENDVCVIKGYIKDLSFNTLEEMESWIDCELESYTRFKEEILFKGYKLLRVNDGYGACGYFNKLFLDYPHRTVGCRRFEGNTREYKEEQILDWDYISAIYDMKLLIRETK